VKVFLLVELVISLTFRGRFPFLMLFVFMSECWAAVGRRECGVWIMMATVPEEV